MSIDYILELIEEEEVMALTINTDSANFKGSDEERCFKMHQQNIMKLKSAVNKFKRYETALKQIQAVAVVKVADIAYQALTA